MTSPQNPRQPGPADYHQNPGQPGPPGPGTTPPPVPNPYGYDPNASAAAGDHPQYPPAGWNHYPPGKPRKRQQDAEPGRFTWWDLGASLFYVLGFLSGLVGLIGLLPPVADFLSSPEEGAAEFGMFLINAASYGILSLIALALSWQALWRSIKRFNYLWWLKLLLIPVGWLTMLALNMLIVIFGFGADPETSENQEAITAMLGAVPFLAAVVVIAVLGPFVEEYFFRHLLIGKLSRHLNVWICGAISVVTFPLLHFIPALLGLSEDLTMVAVVPYLTMGMLITVGYIVAGRNLFYAWLIHAFNNFMALVMAYYVQPWAADIMEDLDTLDAGLALLGSVASMVG